MYNLLINPSDNLLFETPPFLSQFSNPFILWQGKNINFNGKQDIELELPKISLVKPQSLNQKSYKIQNGCHKKGLEKVLLNLKNTSEFYCRYCGSTKANYDGDQCQSCQSQYFSECYANYSNLRPSYWRSDYTVDSSNIEICKNNIQSCVGGNGVGNDLCYEGHIGQQCLQCDINGAYWGERYTSEGFFQCTKCSSISFNFLKLLSKDCKMRYGLFIYLKWVFSILGSHYNNNHTPLLL
ncbi:hypothetical protein TTHERM_00249530 (macronuclear) [Tetrahymena thermophila SB210]|uniref:Transmembrane protein n=1 Tax=Tetrahymena thermophila (strain SB210) TaxID=312017 RepID=Q23QY0_TETTS|nr:hypothetical protein TTHERM_00249530 [Tetrahymena thermophila SB210]EAR98758.4 hypothetical protein TTHERM_00249530 [Tetrahymena thermophila SB210]|eukprot:XP_001019003.4 hypothetical protein TTHERM_00249530 [Tetrahymena thermophila SB210]